MSAALANVGPWEPYAKGWTYRRRSALDAAAFTIDRHAMGLGGPQYAWVAHGPIGDNGVELWCERGTADILAEAQAAADAALARPR